MIQFRNISKSFSGKTILNNINITINDGESVAIIGKSGIGKSVFLKHIIGLIQPDLGNVLIDNLDINQISFRKLQSLRKKIAMVFQFGALFDSMNVEQNIGLALNKLSDLSRIEIQDKIKDSLNSVGMDGTEHLMPSELSGGMKKRIGIARAIALNPKYLLYDEPTTGLDPIMTDSINLLIKKIHNSRKITSIMVTHELRTVYEVVDRVVMLDSQQVIFDGKPRDLVNSNVQIVKEFTLNNKMLKEEGK